MIYALSLALLSTPFVNGALPPNHHAAILNDFAGHIRCPYANEWLSKGPRQAAIDFGLMGNNATAIITSTPKDVNHRRFLQPQEQETVSGSCVFTNEFSKQESCIQMVDSWTLENMETRCSENSGTLSVGTPCALPSSLAGWCHVSDENNVVVESMPMPLTDGMGCDGIKGACETFMSGTFQPDGDCMEVELDSTECDIAPGPIGAAHQAGFSSGYHNKCPGTPAEGSVYMWPLRWTAETKQQNLAYGSDDVVYTSTGRVYYSLDKNWKRMDWFSEKGFFSNPSVGPCGLEDDVQFDEGTGGCYRDHNERRTMIHRGHQMFFLRWKNDTVTDHPDNISDCSWLDLSVVGNVRPDWFMDKRGSSTDVQYLGSQHVYYEGQPRLVRQWRKTDFANMYFVMSMLENPGPDGIHWPMILNVPGEGFGDDSLITYTNHSTLTDAHDDLFLLDQAMEGIGGSCPEMVRDHSNGDTSSFSSKEIPSNLEVDENAWFSNEVTFSPVWEPPTHVGSVAATTGSSSSDHLAVTNVGPATISSCYDSDTETVHLSFTFTEVDAGNLPWIAIGYRESEECRMIPADGSDTPIILLGIDPATGEGMAAKGSLPAAARQMDGDSIAGIYRGLVPLDEVEGYSNVMIELPNPATATARSVDRSDDVVTFSFSQSTEGKEPSTMHLMYAIGSTPQLGYHSVRNCFEVKEFPSCAAEGDHEESVAHMTNSGTANNQYYFMISFAITIAVVSQLFMIV